MGENEQGGMLRTVVVIGLVALIAAVVIGGVVVSKANMNKHLNDTTSLVEKQTDAVTGRNLLLGTKNSAIGVGDDSINGDFGYYNLAGGKKLSDLYNKYGSSGHLTLSFDWIASGSTISGELTPQWYGEPWQGGLGGLGPIKPSNTNTSGHYEVTVSLSDWGCSTSQAGAVRFRQDHLHGNITITNMKLEPGKIATPWTQAPED